MHITWYKRQFRFWATNGVPLKLTSTVNGEQCSSGCRYCGVQCSTRLVDYWQNGHIDLCLSENHFVYVSSHWADERNELYVDDAESFLVLPSTPVRTAHCNTGYRKPEIRAVNEEFLAEDWFPGAYLDFTLYFLHYSPSHLATIYTDTPSLYKLFTHSSRSIFIHFQDLRSFKNLGIFLLFAELKWYSILHLPHQDNLIYEEVHLYFFNIL